MAFVVSQNRAIKEKRHTKVLRRRRPDALSFS